MISSVRGACLLAAILATIPARLGGQEQNLLPHSDPDVRALYEAQTALRVFGDNPFDPISDITSPDSAKLKILDAAASNGAYYLRATADLLAIYENLQCEADRTTIKPLLTDRLRPHSRLLGFEAEKAAIPQWVCEPASDYEESTQTP